MNRWHNNCLPRAGEKILVRAILDGVFITKAGAYSDGKVSDKDFAVGIGICPGNGWEKSEDAYIVPAGWYILLEENGEDFWAQIKESAILGWAEIPQACLEC